MRFYYYKDAFVKFDDGEIFIKIDGNGYKAICPTDENKEYFDFVNGVFDVCYKLVPSNESA